jgi:hypothetical protein
MWLSHNGPEHAERCASIGGTLVCRRCSVLYPSVVLWAVAALVVEPPSVAAVAAMWLLPLPMSVEWVLEQHRPLRYSPRRQVVVTAIASVGVGLALAAHLRHPFDPDALAPMATHVTLCAVSSILAIRRDRTSGSVTGPGDRPSWEVAHDLREAERTRALVRLLPEEDRDPPSTE